MAIASVQEAEMLQVKQDNHLLREQVQAQQRQVHLICSASSAWVYTVACLLTWQPYIIFPCSAMTTYSPADCGAATTQE